ncbi:YMGG-like glycine zipper-containing protein [bacterium]|nr:YMGG-like glycine zipper-containing protein [bacterium]
MRIKYIGLTALMAIVLMACETAGQGTATGALTGGALGAGAGALMGRHSGTGAIVGGVAGAAAGGLIGNQMGRNNQTNRQQDAQINQALEDANTTIVNVPTSTGGTKPVHLTRRGTVWVGPRGEEYTSLPSAEQLSRAYGF